jgi:hypothetical protein
MSPVDHLEAALERVTTKDLEALPPAARRRVYAKLYAWTVVLGTFCELSKPRLRRAPPCREARAG